MPKTKNYIVKLKQRFLDSALSKVKETQKLP